MSWAKPGKTLPEEGVYELFLTVSQKGEVREELPSRECRELCRIIPKTSGHSIGLEGDVCGVSRQKVVPGSGSIALKGFHL